MVAVAVPFEVGSVVEEETVAVFEITVPLGTVFPTATTRVKTAFPGGNDAIELDTVPPDPGAGVIEVHPPGGVKDTKVVPAGNVSDKVTDAALLGPALFTVIV